MQAVRELPPDASADDGVREIPIVYEWVDYRVGVDEICGCVSGFRVSGEVLGVVEDTRNIYTVPRCGVIVVVQ